MFEHTAALWRRLMGRPQPAPAEPQPVAEEERRVWVRFTTDLETSCTTPNQNDAAALFAARIRDISRGGARLLVSRVFDPGSILTIHLPASNGQSSLSVLGCVVHCIPSGDGRWFIGCSFSAELSEDDLRAFGALKAKPTPPDTRNWTRFPVDITATYQFVSDQDALVHPARVRDISASGIAFATEKEIPTGTLLNAVLHGGHGQTFAILACVVHVSSSPDGGFVAGCNFIRQLSEQDLHSLA
jgi:hypothetical protein